MTANQSMFLFTVGFLLTFGGVGGIENSASDAELVTGVLVSGVGLLIMWVGTLGMQVLDNR
jgi:uncharacterized membrane protein (UPF0136 family)